MLSIAHLAQLLAVQQSCKGRKEGKLHLKVGFGKSKVTIAFTFSKSKL